MSGFKISTGQDLDSIFASRTASDPSAQYIDYITSNGLSLSERYLPYTSGTKAIMTGFKFFDTSGNIQDLNDYFSKLVGFGWSALGGGAQSAIRAIYALDSSNVYVGGEFTSVYDVNGNSVAGTSRIAKWNANTSTWSALGGGAQNIVDAIYALDASNVYVGGYFTSVYSSGTTTVAGTSRIAKWNANTSTWTPLGGGAQSYVRAIYALDASNVYVGGGFTSVYSSGTTTVSRTTNIAKWNANTSTWSALARGAQNYVSAIYALDSSNVYVGGEFTSVYDVNGISVAGTSNIAKWNANTSTWSALGGGAQNYVNEIYALDASNVYVVGGFTSVYSSGTTTVTGTSYIAKWNANTSTWTPLGGGADFFVTAIYALDASNVYVGGGFTSVYSSGTTTVAGTSRIAKWDANTSTWTPLGGGAQSSVSAIYALDASNVYVGGSFTSVYSSDTTTVTGTLRIAKWGYS